MTDAIKRFSMLLFSFLVIGVLATGCNTMEGVGEDIEAAGSKIDETAEKKKSY